MRRRVWLLCLVGSLFFGLVAVVVAIPPTTAGADAPLPTCAVITYDPIPTTAAAVASFGTLHILCSDVPAGVAQIVVPVQLAFDQWLEVDVFADGVELGDPSATLPPSFTVSYDGSPGASLLCGGVGCFDNGTEDMQWQGDVAAAPGYPAICQNLCLADSSFTFLPCVNWLGPSSCGMPVYAPAFLYRPPPVGVDALGGAAVVTDSFGPLAGNVIALVAGILFGLALLCWALRFVYRRFGGGA